MRAHALSWRRRLGLVACAALLTFAARPTAAQTHSVEAIDDLTNVSSEIYAIMCNTCSTFTDYSNKALTQYPRASDSIAYVYNLASGQVRGIALDWDIELRRQLGGHELDTDQRLRTFVQQAGSMYRQNSNSLSFKVMLRADGSVYWKPATGAIVELKQAGYRKNATTDGADSAGATLPIGVKANTMPGVNSPIDLRGYQFPHDFFFRYPAFPRTSYDLGFANPGKINTFVRDQMNSLPNGGTSGIFNGTVQSNVGGAAPMNLVSGGQQVTKQIQSQIAVFVPMKDGGFVRVKFDPIQSDITVVEIVDANGNVLPNGNSSPATYLPGHPLYFGGSHGATALNAFLEWAQRYGIPVTAGGAGNSGIVRCMNPTANEVTCTIYPN